MVNAPMMNTTAPSITAREAKPSALLIQFGAVFMPNPSDRSNGGPIQLNNTPLLGTQSKRARMTRLNGGVDSHKHHLGVTAECREIEMKRAALRPDVG